MMIRASDALRSMQRTHDLQQQLDQQLLHTHEMQRQVRKQNVAGVTGALLSSS
jgi:hypothetical protein